MKKVKFLIIISLLCISFSLKSQGYNSFFKGYWYGVLEVQGTELILTFEIKEENDKLTGTLNSPMQGVSGIPITKITAAYDSLHIFVAQLGVSIKGKLSEKDSIIDGIFTQAIYNIPVKFIKTPELFAFNRPQEPQPPFSYVAEDVKFENPHAQIKLAGTLTYPDSQGKFPAAVLITGSGAQNRDEEVLGHKPFFVIADYFTNKGIAVLRVDDRGVGQSGGNFATSTNMDFATDVEAAVEFLRGHQNINQDQKGLLGHSEGGMIAPIVAAKDEDISFIIILAGPALSGEEVLLTQLVKIMEVENADKEVIELMLRDQKNVYNIFKNQPDKQKAADEIREYLTKQAKTIPEEKHSTLGYDKTSIEISAVQLTTPWFRYFLAFNPEKYLSKVECPVFALFGEKDVQITATENVEAIEKIIKKHKKTNIEVKVYPDKNHLFQNANTGAVLEYALIEETICTDVLKDMTNWIWKILE